MNDDQIYRTFADNMPMLGWIANADGYITWYNSRWHQYCGTTPEQMEGWGWQSVHDPAVLPSVMEGWTAAIANGERFEMTFPLRGADGVLRPFLTRVEPFRDEQGVVIRWFGTNTNISSQIEAEQALQAAQQAAETRTAQHRAILAQLAEGVIVTDAEGRITFVNDAARSIHGVAELDVAPEDYSETYHLFTMDGQPYPPLDLPLAHAVRGKAVPDARWRIRRPDGSEAIAAGGARPLFDPEGVQTGAVLTVRDETAREAAEREVRENEARLRALTDNLPGGAVYQINTGVDGTDRRFLYMSQSFEKLTGLSAEAILADPMLVYQMIHPDDRPMMAAAEAEALRLLQSFDAQVRFKRADGTERWCRILSAPRPQRDGSIIWDGIQIDVTDQVIADEALRALNETLEERVSERTAERDRLWLLSEDMLARADYDGRLHAVNPAWTKVLGWSEEKLLTEPYADIIHPENVELVAAALQQMGRTGQPTRFENRILTASGDWKPIGWTVAPEPGSNNFIAVGRDLSEDKARERELMMAQEALRHSQKMEAMGQLTGGVAHDFNNLLTPIVGSLDLLYRKDYGGERERRLIDGALQSADRAKTLVQRLLAFARRQPLQTEAVDVPALVRGMVELIASTSGPRIAVTVDAGADLPAAKADANQLEMAILNLAVNARDAMPEGGKLTIAVKDELVASGQNPRLSAGRYVRLSVADTGAGMDEATMARAIEPFFSTKGIGKGTGLGLSMVEGLASQLGGALALSSRPGLGTRVDLWLPATDEAAIASDRAAENVAPTRSGTVLLVDDEELVRLSAADMLDDLGYTVVEAASADEAIRMMDQGLAFDLLVSDHLMPGMTGAELARAVRSRRPDAGILIVSGYAEVEAIAPDLPRLAKPYRQADLAASLAALRADSAA